MKVILSVPDKITIITHAQNNHHHVRSEQPSSGTLKITIIRYAQN
jgi:hypothetical protein